MGKTPKKAAPGGDERNLCVRRLKATTAPSKASETSLPERQRESESLNRPKLSGIQKKISSTSSKGFKSKLRSPAKLGLKRSKHLSQFSNIPQEEKLLTVSVPNLQITDMQPESEEGEVKLNVSIQKDDCKEEGVSNKDDEPVEIVTEKEEVDHVELEEIAVPQEHIEPKAPENTQESIPIEEQIGSQEKVDEGKSISNEDKELVEQEETDLKLRLVLEEKQDEKEEEIKEKEPQVVQIETKPTNGKEDLQSESQTDTESYSVEIVESTTSEISEASESVSQNTQKEKEKEKVTETTHNDISFVSYDSSIMLKDVQIKLNDCLKENSKLFDVSNTEPKTPIQPPKDMSFGKTLRSISGRHSISRMRYGTLRENRLSPNNSLFVNTSTLSLPPDESTDFKILRYSSGMSDTFSTNGSPVERKRKHEITENWSSAKKQKTESDSSLLNKSVGLFKGLHRPVQVSTPNVAFYKFQSNKIDVSGISDDDTKIIPDANETAKKWCAIM